MAIGDAARPTEMTRVDWDQGYQSKRTPAEQKKDVKLGWLFQTKAGVGTLQCGQHKALVFNTERMGIIDLLKFKFATWTGQVDVKKIILTNKENKPIEMYVSTASLVEAGGINAFKNVSAAQPENLEKATVTAKMSQLRQAIRSQKGDPDLIQELKVLPTANKGEDKTVTLTAEQILSAFETPPRKPSGAPAPTVPSTQTVTEGLRASAKSLTMQADKLRQSAPPASDALRRSSTDLQQLQKQIQTGDTTNAAATAATATADLGKASTEVSRAPAPMQEPAQEAIRDAQEAVANAEEAISQPQPQLAASRSRMTTGSPAPTATSKQSVEAELRASAADLNKQAEQLRKSTPPASDALRRSSTAVQQLQTEIATGNTTSAAQTANNATTELRNASTEVRNAPPTMQEPAQEAINHAQMAVKDAAQFASQPTVSRESRAPTFTLDDIKKLDLKTADAKSETHIKRFGILKSKYSAQLQEAKNDQAMSRELLKKILGDRNIAEASFADINYVKACINTLTDNQASKLKDHPELIALFNAASGKTLDKPAGKGAWRFI